MAKPGYAKKYLKGGSKNILPAYATSRDLIITLPHLSKGYSDVVVRSVAGNTKKANGMAGLNRLNGK